MIKQVHSNYNPVKLEEGVQDYWDEVDAYAKVKASREGGNDFYYVDGPPYTTGSIHLGTATNKTLKDTFIRYKRMNGYNVRDQPGYDMHGLPIEVKVEQSINLKSKKDIEEFGIDRFVSKCKDFALDLQGKMTDQFKRVGIWMDWDRPYLTIKPSYIEAAWWTLMRAYEKDLLTSSNRVLPWCPRCETALAEAEIEYWDERDPSVFVRFPLREESGVSLLIWTTTPWTLPANMAVAVHPDFKYAKVRFRAEGREETVIVLNTQVKTVSELGGYTDYDILELIEGEDLIGLEYVPPFEGMVRYPEGDVRWRHKVVPSHTVEADQTGLVHTAPGHGPEDFEIGKKFDIAAFCPVDEAGRYTAAAGELEGTKVRKANGAIIELLENKGSMFFSGRVEHRYGHCWRCRSPIIYRNTDQWFLKITDVKGQMLKEIERVKWTPEWAGSSREYDWVSNARDWCISRQRYWGIPIPVWRCECGQMRVVGSFKDLSTADGYHEGIEPHRPWIDKLTFECPSCGGVMERVPDVLDVWFDSGVTSWAQLGYPSSTEDFNRWWPARWICEAHDQTRGWFYSQLGAGVVAFERAPYDEVLMHGWVLDPKGKKMSKSKGNVIEPLKVIEQFGADALRLYVLRANAPWEDMAFQHDGPKEARKMLNILWNVVKFATTYMSIDSFDPASVDDDTLESAMRAEDRWMMSKTERLVKTVTEEMDSMMFHKACRAIEGYVMDDLSRWYVRLIRDRMWSEEGDVDKLVAYRVLHHSIMTACKLLAPVCPFIVEEIYRVMDGTETSVHMLDWPMPDLRRMDARLERDMGVVQEIVELVSSERQRMGVKLRWPLKRLAYRGIDKDINKGVKALQGVLLSQANVKTVEFVDPEEEWGELLLSVIPNPHAIGKVYRQWSAKIAVLLENRPAMQIKESIARGDYYLGIEGQRVKIEPNMVTFEYTVPEGIEMVDFDDGRLYVDFNMTPEIEAEGYTRELIRRIQQMRKELKMDVEDYVLAEVRGSARLEEYFRIWREHIMRETRSHELMFAVSPSGDAVKEWDLERESIAIGITPLRFNEVKGAFADVGELSDSTLIALARVGRRKPEDLRGMDETDISSINGVEEADAKRICRHLVYEGSEDESLRSLPKEKMMKFLMGAIGLNEPTSEIIYKAGFDSPEKLKLASLDDLKRADVSSKTAERVHEYFGKEVQKRPTGERVDLESSSTYLFMEERPDNAFRVLRREISEGRPSFIVTRNYPLKIRSKYDLEDAPMVWLSNVGKDNSVRPKDLERLSLQLQQFISKSENGVLLMDGIEYLITNNSFITVLKFIQSLRDMVAMSGSTLIVVVNPSAMEPNEIKLLEKEVDSVI